MAKTILTERFPKYFSILKRSSIWGGYLFLCLFVRFGTSQPYPIDTIQWTGHADQRINMVFLSDGYQAQELDQYILDAHEVAGHFFRQAPFREYQSYFNILAIRVPSNQSGAKKSPDEEHDTYFGSAYNFAGIERLLVASNLLGAQQILLEQVPLFDQAVLIVNDTKYGGSGGWLATTSVHPSSAEIALHEIGHSFAGLADEYWAGEQFAAERPNMSQETRPSEIRWKNWLNSEDIGIYPHRENPIWVRPHQNCKMRVLDPDFCAVCRETIVKRIHDLSNPIISFDPDSLLLSINQDTQLFTVDFLEPDPNTLKVDWQVDEEKITGYDQIKIDGNSVGPDLHSLQMYVVDTTRFIRDVIHNQSHTYNIHWMFNLSEVTSTNSFKKSIHLKLFPNPVHNQLLLSFDAKSEFKSCFVEIFDTSGSRRTRARHGIFLTGIGE